jgi:hypothetical protein
MLLECVSGKRMIVDTAPMQGGVTKYKQWIGSI